MTVRETGVEAGPTSPRARRWPGPPAHRHGAAAVSLHVLPPAHAAARKTKHTAAHCHTMHCKTSCSKHCNKYDEIQHALPPQISRCGWNCIVPLPYRSERHIGIAASRYCSLPLQHPVIAASSCGIPLLQRPVAASRYCSIPLRQPDIAASRCGSPLLQHPIAAYRYCSIP